MSFKENLRKFEDSNGGILSSSNPCIFVNNDSSFQRRSSVKNKPVSFKQPLKEKKSATLPNSETFSSIREQYVCDGKLTNQHKNFLNRVNRNRVLNLKECETCSKSIKGIIL